MRGYLHIVVTNLGRSPKRVIKFYNGRGTAEQWIKEGQNALNWTQLSCRRFKDNLATCGNWRETGPCGHGH